MLIFYSQKEMFAIQDCKLQPEYLHGRRNTVADYFSREFHNIPEKTVDEDRIAN